MPSRFRPKRIYLDYAASTPVAPEVFRAMRPYFSEKFGNPGSLHSFGQEAMAVVDRSRETVARALGAQFREMVFTGSATEANNLALRGGLKALRKSITATTGAGGADPNPGSRLIVSAVEHESVLETARDLEREGVPVTVLPVDKRGVVKLDALASALAGRPALVSIMYANNETGAVQPLAKISKLACEAGAILHTDAAQAFQFLDCSVDALGVDLLTLSAHKIYGPKGAGALYVRGGKPKTKSPASRVFPEPILSGGGQEFGMRSGTENVPLIAGLAAAVEYIENNKEGHARRIAAMRQGLIRELGKTYPKARLNDAKETLPHILNIWIPGLKAEDLLIRLDLAGIAVSAGSACAARSSQPSHVLLAMGVGAKRAKESMRISLGRPTTPDEIRQLLKVLRSL